MTDSNILAEDLKFMMKAFKLEKIKPVKCPDCSRDSIYIFYGEGQGLCGYCSPREHKQFLKLLNESINE